MDRASVGTGAWNAFSAEGGLTAVFAQTPVAMAVLEGRELRYSFANPRYHQIIGGRNPVGLRLVEMFPELAGSEIERVIENVYDSQVPFVATDLLIRFDSQGTGEIDNYYDLAYHPLLTAETESRGVLVVAVDITERHAAQVREREIAATEAARVAAEAGLAQIEAVFRQASAFLAVTEGPDHVYTLANEAYYQLIGRGRDIIGKPLLEALPEFAGQGFDDLLDTVLRTGEPFVAREIPVRLERTGGSVPENRVVSLTYSPLLDKAGDRMGVIAHGADVTEYVLARRTVEALLAESEAARAEANEAARSAHSARVEAEAANRAKAEFLAVMSHELRTPRNAIGGYAELLEMGVRGPISDEQRADLHRIQRSQRHLLGLIEQVLNHTRAGVTEHRYLPTNVNAATALTDAELLIDPQMRARELEYVVLSCDPALMVRADASKLEQILVNLLNNAVKFTSPGGHISAACVSDDNIVTFSIADTGIGIAAARDMGGDLTVQSVPGLGSRFELTLPVARA